MLPRLGASKLVSTWLLVLLAASIVAMLDGGWLASWTALAPRRIWRGEVWRLVTWVFVERGPYALLVTGFCVYRFAGRNYLASPPRGVEVSSPRRARRRDRPHRAQFRSGSAEVVRAPVFTARTV